MPGAQGRPRFRYVEIGELKEAGSVRTQSRDKWAPVTEHFAVYEARDGHYLFEFDRACREMFDNSRITPDRRYDHSVMRRGVDTLRGCRIDKIYELTEGQAQEIEALAKSAGGGN